MFFNRLGRKSCSTPSTTDQQRLNRRASSIRQRRAAVLGIAAAVTVPLTLAQTHLLRAESIAPILAVEQPDLGPAELLNLGVQQYDNKQYEEAVVTLQQVNAGQLNEQQQATLRQTLAQADSAADQRRAARAAFEQGEKALRENRAADAIEHYQSAARNEYADQGTRNKATEQLALAQEASRSATQDARAVYQQGVKQYESGDWVNARKSFETAHAAGYRPGGFQDSPETYLNRMRRQEQAEAQKLAQAAQSARSGAAPAQVAAADSDVETADPVAAATEISPAPVIANAGSSPQGTPAESSPDLEGAQATPAPAAPAPATGAARPSSQDQANQDQANQDQAVADQTAGEPSAPVAGDTQAVSTPEQDLQATAQLERIRRQQQAFEAQTLVEQARAAAADRRYDDALRLYTRAAELDASNQQAAAGRQEMAQLTGRATGDLLSEQQRRILAQREAIQYQFDTAIANARQAINDTQWAEAERQLQNARVQRSAATAVFAPGDLAQFDGALASVEQSLSQARGQFQTAEHQQQTAEATQAELERLQSEREQIRRTVSQLVRNAMQLIQESKYHEAMRVIDQVLAIDPTNDYASGVRPLIEDRLTLQDQRAYREEVTRQYERVLNAAEEKMIPYDDIIRYPSNWPDITEMRDRTNAEQGRSQADVAVQAQLDRRLPELRFEQVPFDEVVNFLRDVTSANIFVNWRALESAGVDKNTAVSARLRDVKFSKALEIILKDVGGGIVQLGYTVDEGVITISTLEDLSRNVITRTYDIRDLIINVPDFTNPPNFDLSAATNQGGGGRGGRGGGGGGSGQGLFGNTGTQSQQEPAGVSREELVTQITELITETVAPDSWREAGGTVGSVREMQGQLIVTQTPENHRQLSALLEQLREQRAIQVSIEARFLTVQRNFLEDIGMDLDVSLNTQSGPYSRWSPVEVNQNSYLFTSTIDTTIPGNLSGSFGGDEGTAPALSLGGGGGSPITYGNAFLDDFQVSLLLRATQATQSTTLLTAPRITLFNGQRAYVVVATQRAYVSDLNATVAQGAVAYDPEIDVISSGVILNVQATVSADRKYVTLTLEPQLARILQIFQFAFASAEAAPGVGTGTGATTLMGATGVVQQPEIQITSVKTTVSIPDQGTLLIGGQTLSGEIEREAGVPVLSKIPFLKRLFTNRSIAKDDQVLLILVKPTIIIQREQEERQFPLLSTQIAR